MATSSEVTQEENEMKALERSFEHIVMACHKIKYINPKFKKLKAKMYDYKCDVKLRVGNANFKAHKEVLSEASDYFSAMFSHDMLEKEKDVINLLEMSPTGFSLILDYLYHGHVTIEPDTAEDILESARFFQVDWLVEVCCDYLIHELSIENYQTVLHLADTYWLGDLRGDIFHFLGLNIVELSKEPNFYKNFDFELLTQFLREEIYVEAEENFMLNLVIKWVEADREERQQFLLPLLRLIRFSLMDNDALSKIPDSVLQWPEIEDAVEEAKFYNNNVPMQGLCKGKHFQPRGSKPSVVMFHFAPDYCAVMYQDLIAGHQCHEELMSTGPESGFESSSIAVAGNFLYRSGGYDDTVCSSDLLFRYNPRFRDWTQLASLHQARVSHTMCQAGDKLFVVGGINHTYGEGGDHDEILKSVEMYDIKGNTWHICPCLPSGSYNQAAAFYDNCLYVCGGISNDPFDAVPTQSLWCFNVDEDSWTMRKDMLYQRQGHSMTTLSGKLYVFGGYTCFTNRRRHVDQVFRDCFSSEVYNIETDQWTEIKAIPDSFGHVMRSVGLWENRFIFFGSGHLHTYHVDDDRMEHGDYVGLGVQKIAVLNVAFPTAH